MEAKVGGRDEGVGVQGNAGEIGLGLMIELATVSRAGDYPRPTFAIVLVRRRPVDHGFASPVLFSVCGWMYGVGTKGWWPGVG
ncbi:MAG: hypothetical protein WCK53_12655 [Methanomicrobiales archaeon]